MALKLIASASALVTLPELKRHVRATDFDDDDAYLQDLALVAQEHISGPAGWLGRSFGGQTWQMVLNCFPSGAIYLPRPPVQSLTSVKYTDTSGIEQTLSGVRLFSVGMTSDPGYILPEYDGDWPDTREEPEAVRITFVSGADGAPPPVKHAILLLVGQWYRSRENASEIAMKVMPSAVDALLMPFKFWNH